MDRFSAAESSLRAEPSLQIDDLGASELNGADILVLSPTPTWPTDQGNRKRIYAVCSELKRRGARIHFVFFPQEWWFLHVPQDLVRTMTAQWDSFHLVPPSRPLYQRPAAEDYHIDEWWDDAIGDYLQWLFKRARFDAFVVNYAYLSKAFEYAPSKTLRILDTHDKFTGRRELLQANGVQPEFFYTTLEQEAIALGRAQLVWAIKDEEAVFYRGASPTPCITLPHIEPMVHTERRRRAQDEGRLVVGMLGSTNSINVTNARVFVAQALPQLKQRGAPVTIRLAGGMCAKLTDLEGLDGLDLLGPVDRVESFYQDVDLVIVPLAFSTGLKIKAVEAIASGMPIVALGHALEGIPCDHPWQRCATMVDLVDVCCEIAADPDQHLPVLARSTREADERIRAMAAAAFDDTAQRAMRHPRAVIAIGREFFDPESLYREHVFQTINLLNQLMAVTLFVDQPLPTSQTALFEAFHGLASDCKLAVSPDCGEVGMRSLGIFSQQTTLAKLLAASRTGPVVLWALRIGEELRRIDPQDSRVSLMVRRDTLRLYQPTLQDTDLDAVMRHFQEVTLMDSDPHAASGTGSDGVRLMTVPFWRWKPWMLASDANHRHVDVLARADQVALAHVLANAVREFHPQWSAPRVVSQHASVPAGAKNTQLDVAVLMGRSARAYPLPSISLDISGGAPELEIYRETLLRVGIPVMTPPTNGTSGVPTLRDWIDLIERLEREQAAAVDQAGVELRLRYGSDAGWIHTWSRLSFKKVFG